MRITTQAEYGLLCVLHLARRGRLIAVPVREVAAAEGLPPQYCEKIFADLRRAGVVESTRGAAGGFRLARDPEAISVKAVIDATAGGTFELNCADHPVSAERCQGTAACSLRPVWLALRTRIDGFLAGIRLADLLRDEAEVQARLAADARTSSAAASGADAPAREAPNLHAATAT
jgi:Rrf2 family protein